MIMDLIVVLVFTSILLGSMAIFELFRTQVTRLYRLIHIKKLQKETH